jgi:small-conductance mechanosensitive channel
MGGVGRRLSEHIPLWILVGIQGFRLQMELAMHTMVDRGIMPEQMSYTGRNFDIITGITAIAVAALVATNRAGRSLVLIWNVIGIALLMNIVGVALVSTPIFALFGPDRLNVWITYPPFVWLPAVMVLAALTGHLVIFRAAARTRPR